MKIIEIINNFGTSDYLFLIGITLTVYVAQFYYEYFTRVNPLPGPLPFPFFGNFLQFLLHGGNLKSFLEYNHKKYGDLYELYMKNRGIILNRAEHIEKISTPSTKNPYLARPVLGGLDELGLVGKGISVNNNLESWRHNRQFFTKAILTPKFTREAIDGVNKLFNEMTDYWDKLYLQGKVKENNNKLDLPKWMSQYTSDMIVPLLTGEESHTMAAYFNTLSDEKAKYSPMIIEDSTKLVEAFNKYIMGIAHFVTVPPLLRHYVPYFKKKSDYHRQNIEFVYQRFDTIITRRRQEIENTPLDEPLPRDILTSVIISNTPRDVNYDNTAGKETMVPMTDVEIRHILLDGFIAGTDTTANSISFIIYYLAHNPDVKKKMLEEIDRIFQGDKTRPITEDDFHNLKYCEAIAKEVARVLPVVFTFSRCSEKSDEIAGYQWPAGTLFRVNSNSIHKNNDCWEEPEKFNPDRWLVDGFEPKKYSFVMFGGGLRICPGRKLAMVELVCLMALLFRKYEIDLVDMNAPLKTKATMVNSCSELLIKIKLRN